MSFDEILQNILERRTSRSLELLTPQSPEGRLPFAVATAFHEIYASVLRAGVFPLMIRRRQMINLEKQYDWAEDGEKKFVEIIKSKANPVFESWDNAWESLWDDFDPNVQQQSSPGPGRGAGPQGKHGKSGKAANGHAGGLFGAVKGLLSREGSASAAEEEDDPTPSEPRPVMEGLRVLMEHHAAANDYMPPRADDVTVLKEIVRVHPRTVGDAWRELTQVHRQEFTPTDPNEVARPGSLSEAIVKWQYSLPQRIGELLAVKAAAELEYCDANFVRQFIRQSARSQEEGERSMPYLAAYQKSMAAIIR